MASGKTTRRSFIAQSTAACGAAMAAPAVLCAATRASQLNVACVGVNGMGWADLSSVGSHAGVRFVGFCDVDSNRFEKVDAAFPGVTHFADYRQMFADIGKSIDAVIVSTPDHMHAPIAMMAMKMGKHIYCQKPLTHTVWEARQMRLMADKAGVITQMGNQIHSNAEYRRGVQLIHNGAIGKVKEVHSWVGVSGRQHSGFTERPPEAPVPVNLNWDLWLGAAPVRPFAEKAYHAFNWRDWQDFGSGAMGDFGCHILDPVFGALELTAPTSIRAEHAGTNQEVWPGAETITFDFPGTARTSGSSIRVIWRDGGLKPPRELAQLPDGMELPPNGSLFIGEEGVMLLPHVGMPSLYPQKKFESYAIPEIPGGSHWHIWVEAVLAGKRTSDGFHYAGPLTEAVQLGNIAARLPGTELKWDAAALRFTNHEPANTLLTKTYRDGFGVEAVTA
ncbi:MAG: Gfo/Idh/MocA family protein [Planctomyces sp.]